MATWAKAVKTTQNSKEVRYIIADLDCVKVESISGSVLNSGKYGINGTVFNSSNGNLLGIAVNNNGSGAAAVRTGGHQTADASGGTLATKRGVLYHYSPSNGVIFITNEIVKGYLDPSGATKSNIKWAIGGYSLHLGKSYANDTAYYNEINASPEYCSNFGPSGQNGRSAIGYAYIDGGRKIIMATFKDATCWEVRTFMKNLGCTYGVHLDGSGSSQLRYKRKLNPISSSEIDEAWEPKPDTKTRSVFNMVSVNPTYWQDGTGFF